MCGSLVAQTTNNRPRIDDGGVGADDHCHGGVLGAGAAQVFFTPSSPYTGAVPSDLTHNPEPGSDPMTVADPHLPSAQGSTIALDGSSFYHFDLPAVPGIAGFSLPIGLSYRTFTANGCGSRIE
ncbi:MAG: hypothetical protein IPM29_17295 [Planctomycetes bacterium]|nr:hypothetical protein [Planctomycetota bacterium]